MSPAITFCSIKLGAKVLSNTTGMPVLLPKATDPAAARRKLGGTLIRAAAR